MYKFNTNDYLVRIPLFIIFFWFGFLKIIDLSPAQQFVQDTVYWMPFLSAADWTVVIGIWEVFIALFFLFKRTTFIAMILLMIQMTPGLLLINFHKIKVVMEPLRLLVLKKFSLEVHFQLK